MSLCNQKGFSPDLMTWAAKEIRASASSLQVKNLEFANLSEYSASVTPAYFLNTAGLLMPVFAPSGEVSAVLDIDSEHLATFDVTDKEWLEQIVATLYE